MSVMQLLHVMTDFAKVLFKVLLILFEVLFANMIMLIKVDLHSAF